MKTHILLIFSVLFYGSLYAQVLGQDKEGFSSIVQPSASFNLDFTDKVVTLNFYQEHFKKEDPNAIQIPYNSDELNRLKSENIEQYKSMLIDSWKTQESIFKKRGFIYGVDLKGRSSDGLTQLISNEQLLTSSSISGLIGLRWHKRSYIEGKKLDEYVTKSYNYTGQNSKKELDLIADIEKVINHLLEAKIIDKGKKDDLLHFMSMKSKEDKIESLNNKISSIKTQSGFMDQAKEIHAIEERIETLKKMLAQIPVIQAAITKYNATVNINDILNQQNKVDSKELRTNIDLFDAYLKSEHIKPLNLKIEYEDFKDLESAATWTNAKTTIEDALKASMYNLSELSEIKEKGTTYSKESIMNAYEAYKSFLENNNTDMFADLQIAKGNTYTILRNLMYFKAGFLGSSFKYDLANSSTAIADRFESKNFQGYRLELGYTRQFKRYNFLGLNLAMNRTSNAEDLTSTTYKFETTDTSVTPNITTGTEFKALSGPFDTFFKYTLSFDYVRLVPFYDSNASEEEMKKSRLLLSINPYIRHNFYSNSETLKPNTSIGLGFYSFNKKSGTIAGGLFVQADDLFNKNREGAINFTKQISVGIVFKVAIKSFNPVDE
ncbi:hypothetical protein [Flavobacterium hibisci]|uniref:hypothetical protein n=1 Tax=Flavobacterium hibisci TaxID=1914462 RepID=UPI001CBAF628|nr:hypothetical protein [Flavobacterium hibisci]MBZ4042087.1 hypothetical protein [Flavobacterium hibisci]